MSKGDAVAVPQGVVLEVLRTKYDICDKDDTSVEISGLPSYDDQNFRVKRTVCVGTEEKRIEQFVLKIANRYEVYEALDLQNKTMAHLKSKGVTAPYVIASNTNEMILSLNVLENEPPRFVRLLSFLEGKVLSQAKCMTKELFTSIGRSLAQLNEALSDFDHPAAAKRGEELDWNLANAGRVLANIDAIRHYESKERVQLVEQIREKFEQTTHRFDELPNGMTQGDANEGNIIINHEETSVVGFIDYGDAALVKRVFDLAIVLAYCMLPSTNKPNLTSTDINSAVLSGYKSVLSLTNAELDCLPVLVATRLCISVTMSARSKLQNPPNLDYILLDETRAWTLLEELIQGLK